MFLTVSQRRELSSNPDAFPGVSSSEPPSQGISEEQRPVQRIGPVASRLSPSDQEGIQQNVSLIARIRLVIDILFYRLYAATNRPPISRTIPIDLYVLLYAGKGPRENYNDHPRLYAEAKAQLLAMTPKNLQDTPGAMHVYLQLHLYDDQAFRMEQARKYMEMILSRSMEERVKFSKTHNGEYWVHHMCGEEFNILWKTEGYAERYFEQQKREATLVYHFENQQLEPRNRSILTAHKKIWNDMTLLKKAQKTMPSVLLISAIAGALWILFKDANRMQY